MDLYLTTFTLPKGSPPTGTPRADGGARTPSAPLSSSPESRVVGSRAGLAVSPPGALAPGSMRPGAMRSPDAAPGRPERAPSATDSTDLSLDAPSRSPSFSSFDLAEVVPRLGQKVMNKHHCLVNVAPCSEGAPDGSFAASPHQAPFSPGPIAQSPSSRLPSASEPGESAPARSASTASLQHAQASVPSSTSPKYSFNMCGTQSQVQDARGALLQELPFAWKVLVKVPCADVVATSNESQAPSNGVVRADVRAKLDEIMQLSNTQITAVQLDSHGVELGAGLEVDRNVQFVVAGSIESIEFARVQLLLYLDHLHGLHVEQIEIDRKLHHISAGRKRGVLQLIEEETQTTVYLSSPFAGVLQSGTPAAVASKRNIVYITGRFYNTQRARDMILQLTASKAKTQVSKTVTLMPRKLDWLLQERLEALRLLMLDNSTFLELPVIGSQQGQVTVLGTNRVDVERSIRTLMQLVSPYYTANVWLLPGSYDALGLSSKPDTRVLSSIVTSISAGTNAEIVFQNNHFEISGLDREVRAALRQLMRVPTLKHYTYEFRFQLELATDHREFISGKKNGKINKIMEHCGVRIRFEPFNEYNFLIDVLGTELDAALQGLGLLQEELPAEMSFHVPEAYHKRIIGVGGKNIQRIMKKFGVYVKFSNAEEFAALGGYMDNDDNVIARTPSKNSSNLENLKNSVMELVSPKDKDFVTETVAVPRKHQRALLGEKAVHMHEIERKTRCVVRFARRESALDVVQIFGPESQIAVAVQMLLQHVPLEAEVVVPNSYELGAMLESKDYTLLQERVQKELGITLTTGHRAPNDQGECSLRLSVPRANLELLPMAKSMLDELCAQHNVHMTSTPSADAFQAPMPPFSTSLMSPPLDTAASDTFHQDTAATAASVAAAGTRYDDASSSAAPGAGAKDLKALFEQPSAPGGMAFDSTSNTPLMPSFYTPGYTDGSSLSNPVWGAPLPSMSEMNTHASKNTSMFSPFSAPMAFPFAGSDPALGKPDNSRAHAAFHPHQPIRRPDAMGGGVPSSVPPSAFPPHPLSRLPLGMHGNSGMGNDIDGFHPIGEHAHQMPNLPMMHGPGSGPASRHGNMGLMRNPTSPGATPDTMDEVSRVLAQIAFDKQ